MSMKLEKQCKKCLCVSLLTIDYHDFCKPCRQPLPNVFECPGNCKICEKINESTVLAHRLKKHEIRRQKKVLLLATNLKESENYKQSFKNGNSSLGISCTGNKVDDKSWKISLPNLKNEETVMETTNMQCTQKFSYNTDSDDNRLFSKLKNKVFGKGLMNYSNNFEPETVATVNTHIPKTDKENMALYNKFCEFMLLQGENNGSKDNLVSLHETSDSELKEKPLDAVNFEDKKNSLYKVSSKASDILLSSTILSFPLQADELRKKLKLVENSVTWPVDISHTDLLNIHTNNLPVMKLHPKVRHLQKFLFNKLSPSLPHDVLSPGFILPPISLDLENKFYFARKQLQRSLFMFSELDSYYNEEKVNASIKYKIIFEQIFCHLKDAIETQGNFVGLLLHDIRKELLRDVICKDSEAITKLITGSVNEIQFFGPYVNDLQSLVKKKGSSFCLRHVEKPKLEKPSPKPSLNLAKLPKPFEIGGNAHDFLMDLKSYFINNEISENDKVAVLETLLPSTLVNKIRMFLNPAKCSTKNFEEISIYFERVVLCGENFDYLSKRLIFKNIKQEANQSIAAFAKELKEKITDCYYGLPEKELLRDQFIFGLKDNDIRQELLDKYYFTFEQCCTLAASKEIKTKLKSNKAIAINKNSKVQPKESLKLKNEFSEQPVIPCIKKESEIKEIINLKENILNEQKINPNTKRKLDAEESVKLPVKKARQIENSFYAHYNIFYDNPKLETIQIKSKQQWSKYFGTEAASGYKILCPWTGKILRSK